MTVAVGIEIQIAGRSGSAPGQLQGGTPGAESFRSNWQDQLASLSSVGEGRGAGVPALVQSAAKGLNADATKIEFSQPGGSSNPERAARSESTKAAAKAQERTASEVGSPAAGTPIHIPSSEIRNIAEARINPAKAEISASSLSAHGSDDFTAKATNDSSFVASRGVAAVGAGQRQGEQTVPMARPAEIHSLGQVNSGSTGNRSIAAQDSNEIETQSRSLDKQSGYDATEVPASTPSAEPPAVGRINAEPLAKGQEMNHALSATADAQKGPIQVTVAGMEPVAGLQQVSQFNPPPANPLPSGEPNQANPGVSGSNSASVHGTKRTQLAAGLGTDRTSSVQTQIAAVFADATAMVRDPASGRELANPTSAGVTATGEPALRETFAALDADASPGALTWTHASPHQAEAGFQDPALGWIGVRADRNGGGIHAALVPGSAEASVELGGHLEGLNAYLTAQHTPVESLGMAAPGGSASGHSAEQNPGQGMGHGMDQGGGRGAGRGAGQNAQQQSFVEPESATAIHGFERSGTSGAPDQSAGRDMTAQVQGGGGAYISVVA